MAQLTEFEANGRAPAAAPPPHQVPRNRQQVDDAVFRAAFGESLSRVLDLSTWQAGDDLGQILGQLRQEVREAVVDEGSLLQVIRSHVFPRIVERQHNVPGAGVFSVTPAQLEQVHRGLLLNGGVEACDGNAAIHDALPLSVIRIGVSLLSYNGAMSRYSQQFFRRDLRWNDQNSLDMLLELLDRRSERDVLSTLGRRGLMAYAERAVLTNESKAVWRMGHGSPMPVELLSGSGSKALLVEGANVVRKLVAEHQRFVFIPSTARERDLLTIGSALRPLEFAVLDTVEAALSRIVDATNYYGEGTAQIARQFVQDVGPQIVVGVFRASAVAPAAVFYAHKDHAAEAAAIALADSAMQRHRGFPLLIDLAARFCREYFGQDTLQSVAQEAYADEGMPFRFQLAGDSLGKG